MNPAADEDFLIRHRWVAGADRDVMNYVCLEQQRLTLEAEDPLQAATVFVQEDVLRLAVS